MAAIQPNVGVRRWYEHELFTLLEAAQYEIILELSLALAKQPVKLAADAKYTHRIIYKGGVASEHESLANAEKQRSRLVHMSNGRLTEKAFEIEPIQAAVSRATPVVNLDLTMKRWAKKWTLKFDKLATTVSKRFAARNFQATESAMTGALKKSGFTVAFKPTLASMNAYRAVVAENVGLIKNLPSQYVTNVQSAVWTSVNKGADMAALSQKLRENFDITAKRAALIAVDQNNKAKAVIENTRRQQLGIKKAIWQHSSAGKEPRPTHVEMEGVEFDLSKGMFDPDANGKGKGEWIWPGQLINCRCTSRAIIPGLDNA